MSTPRSLHREAMNCDWQALILARDQRRAGYRIAFRAQPAKSWLFTLLSLFF